MKTETKILNRIAVCAGATTIGLLAQDVRRAPGTVARYVQALVEAGRVEIAPDGLGLTLSVSEIVERQTDARVKSHK